MSPLYGRVPHGLTNSVCLPRNQVDRSQGPLLRQMSLAGSNCAHRMRIVRGIGVRQVSRPTSNGNYDRDVELFCVKGRRRWPNRHISTSNCYCTSREIASVLMASTLGCGIGTKIVLIVGFKFGRLTFLALVQSMCTDESWDSQWARSCDSLENLGSGLVGLLTNSSLLAVHVSI